MNRIILISLILRLSLSQTLSFESKDVCLKETVHVNKYDEHFELLETETKMNCSNEAYPVDCGPENCAASKEACGSFINKKLIAKIFKLSNFLSKVTDSIENQIQEIKSCAKSPYTFNSTDICSNSQTCLKRFWARHNNKDVRILVPIKCKCLADLSYDCGKSHCTVHKDACDSFQSQNNIIGSAQIKVCANFVII